MLKQQMTATGKRVTTQSNSDEPNVKQLEQLDVRHHGETGNDEARRKALSPSPSAVGVGVVDG